MSEYTDSLRYKEIKKIEEMLQEEKLKRFERYVLNEYLESLYYGK